MAIQCYSKGPGFEMRPRAGYELSSRLHGVTMGQQQVLYQSPLQLKIDVNYMGYEYAKRY